MQSLHMMIKPVSGECNLACEYCFYKDVLRSDGQRKFGRMNRETLEVIFRRAAEFARGECIISYQGGEPTLAGLEFYQMAAGLEKQYLGKFRKRTHNIQTNGILLDESWIRFLKSENYLVGISLDGTAEYHNKYRRYPGGKHSFQRVMRSIELMNAHGLPYNVLTVVYNENAGHIRKIYNFYKKMGIRYVQFIPCLDSVEGGEKRLTAERYGYFLRELFDLWYEDWLRGEALSVSLFEEYIGILAGKAPVTCGSGGMCGVQNVIEANGNVYPCDYAAFDRYCLGNLHENSFEDIYRRRQEIWFGQETGYSPKCMSCRYLPLCQNRCRRYGAGAEHPYCSALSEFFSCAIGRMEKIASLKF